MYPKIIQRTYYNDVVHDNFLNLQDDLYEVKFFYSPSEGVEVEILVGDTHLTIRKYGDSVSYAEESGKRYLYPVGVGEYRLEVYYDISTGPIPNVIHDTFNFTAFVKSYYPKIKITFYKDGVQQLNYLDIENQEYEMRVALQFSDTEQVTIPINDTHLHLEIFDYNAFYKEDGGKRYIVTNKKGTCTIGAYYEYGSQLFSTKHEILIYEPFFRKEFALVGMSSYDYSIYQSNTQYRVFMDTLFEFLDILYAYYDDIGDINNIKMVKSKFLEAIGISMGFEKKALYNETKWEYAYDRLYRELIANLLDLIQLRGTKLSYELFFGALGYDVEMLEYWFDCNGNLIEVNYDDFDSSTFFAYTPEGLPLEDIQVAHVDPRKDVSASNAYNYCSKSKYVRVVLTLKSGLYHPANESTVNERILIRQYLDWIRPNHIEYLQEILKMNITRYGEGTYDIGEHLISLVDLYAGALDLATLVELVGIYISPTDVYTTMSPLTEVPHNPGWPYWAPPVGLISNQEHIYHGAWHSDITGYGDNRGICIEYLKMLTDSFILGGVRDFYESIESPIRYDLTDPYEYDQGDDKSKGIKYDKGIIFSEKELQSINLNAFTSLYTSYKKTHTAAQTKAYLMNFYGITSDQYAVILTMITV